MKNKLFKIIGIIFIVLVIFNIVSAIISISHALSDVTLRPELWVDTSQDVGEGTLNVKAKPILTIIRVFGIIVSVITLAIIALKIMFASLEEKAAYKQMLLPWAAGAIMLFAMTTIPGIIYDVVQNGEIEIDEQETRTKTCYLCKNGNQMKYTGTNISGPSKGWACDTEGCDCRDYLGSTYEGCGTCFTKVTMVNGQLYCPKCGTLFKD